MNWNEERVELLRKLWSEGLSASQIAAQLGSVSRNAVIGKVHRLKLSSRGRATAAPRVRRRLRTAPARPRAALVPPALFAPCRPRSAPRPCRSPSRLNLWSHHRRRGKRRRADFAPASAGRAERAHLQMAQRRPACRRISASVATKWRNRPILLLSCAHGIPAGFGAAPGALTAAARSVPVERVSRLWLSLNHFRKGSGQSHPLRRKRQ